MTRMAALLLLAVAACGGGSSSSGATFSGVVRGQPMKPVDAISSPARVSLGAVGADVAAIVLTDTSGVCGKVTANTEPKNGKALIILLADFNASAFAATAPAGAATFDIINPSLPGVPPAHLAVATFGVNDASCAEVPAQSAVATSGSVKVISIANGAYNGTYTIGFDTGEQVSGEFHTATCPGLSSYLANTTHSCGG